MAAATLNFKRHMAGGCVAGLINPEGPCRTRDHAKQNVKVMREKERQLRGQRLLEAARPPPELFKMKQFAGAKSRFQQGGGANSGVMRLADFQEEVDNLIKAHGKPPAAAAQHDVGTSAGKGHAGPGGCEGAADAACGGESVCRLVEASGPRTAAAAVDKQNTATFEKDGDGCPIYLRMMAEDRQERQRVEDTARARTQVPDGCKHLPADEVAETLAALNIKRQELEADFRKLPLKISTGSQKRREKKILDDIAESDKAIALLSKPMA